MPFIKLLHVEGFLLRAVGISALIGKLRASQHPNLVKQIIISLTIKNEELRD
jgi:hypothetical protein